MKQIISVSWDKNTHDVRWEKEGISHGYGYQNKDTHKIGMLRCPMCDLENYAMNVSSGLCTWCPFNANKNNYEEASLWLENNPKS